jgi:poly(3-hydroxybutyrate) depolymerase
MERLGILARTAGLSVALWLAALSEAVAQGALVDYESAAAHSMEVAQWRLAFRPPLSVTAQTVAQLRASSSAAPSVIAETDRLVKEASSQPEPDARRTLWRAATLLQQRAWTPQTELLGALALRTESPVSTGSDERITLQTLYPMSVSGGARFSLDLFKAEPTSSATPKKGDRVARLTQGEVGLSLPSQVNVNLSSVADGAYLLVAEVSFGSEPGGELVQSLYVVRDLASRYAALKSKLDSLVGHETAKWTAEYPFVLAEALHAGTRDIISYDFPRAIARSARITEDLRAGHDDLWQAKGLQDRAHALRETGELVPYQLYVPSTWTPKRSWPLVVALHGANLDETNMLGRADGQMQALAERYGFIVAAPLGYKLNSWYGSERALDGARVGQTPEEARRRQLSEQDVLEVAALVGKEYRVDPRRRYLTGNSMGGGGTWWIGGHHSQLWAAIAPAAYGGVLPQDVRGLSGIPIFAVVGDHDEVGMLGRVRASIATLEAGGVRPHYIEVAGGTHASAYDIALPRIFEFFSQHVR